MFKFLLLLVVAVYCAAGAFIVKDAQNVSSCEGCPKHTYKEESKYYAEECTSCPGNKPRTMIVNATSLADCRFGAYSYL